MGLLTAIPVAVCAATFADPADATPSHCGNLQGRRLLRNHTIEVVERGDEARDFVYACVPPNGRVRLVGSAYDGTVTGTYSIRIIAVAGTWVAADFTGTLDFHTSEEIDKVFDARSGRSYRFFEAFIPQGQGFEEVPSTAGSVERVVLNRSGQLALALIEERKCRIVGIEPSGSARVLDSAPQAQIAPSSLTLRGHTVHWVDAGSARSATL